MKVIFLDIDGVLVNRQSWHDRIHKHAGADPECVAQLNRIIAATGADIVVSSTWRIGATLTELRETINLHFGVTGRIIGKTPHLTTRKLYEGKPGMIEVSADRGYEIDAWLKSYQRYPIESFVILDDDDMGSHCGRLVRSNFDEGLTADLADRAIAMLRAEIEGRKL